MPELGSREPTLIKQNLWNKIQDCHKQLLEFSFDDEVFLFEENEAIKKLDWTVRDFSKNVQASMTEEGPPDTSGARLCSEFEKLVVAYTVKVR